MNAIVLGIIALVCFTISCLQLKEKGVLLNNAYIFASEQEREIMDKKPHYKQSGVVFLLLGIIFLIDAINVILQIEWLFHCVIVIAVVVIVYAIISSVTNLWGGQREKEFEK